MNTMPGPALPVSVVTSGPVVGGPAIPVYGYSAAPTDGRAVSGGPATRVKVLSASDLVANGGTFYLAGVPLALPVVTASANTPVAGGPVMAVYPVNAGWPVVPVLPQVASATLLLDLRASQLALSDGTPVATWADASGNGNDFTQSGSARPTYRAGDGVPYVFFNAGTPNSMVGPDFADNLSSFAVFGSSNKAGAINDLILSKINDDETDPGWMARMGNVVAYSSNENDGIFLEKNDVPTDAIIRTTCIFIPPGASSALFSNGSAAGVQNLSYGNLTDFANAQPVRLGDIGNGNYPFAGKIYAVLLYAPAPSASDRAAIETWLATNP